MYLEWIICLVYLLVTHDFLLCGQVKQWVVWTWGTSLHLIRVTVVRALTNWALKAVIKREMTRTVATLRTKSTLLCRLLSPPPRCSKASHPLSAYIAKMYFIHHVCHCCVSCQCYCLYIWIYTVYNSANNWHNLDILVLFNFPVVLMQPWWHDSYYD